MKRGSGNRTRRDSSIEDENQIGSQLSRSRFSATQDDHVPIDSSLAKLIVLMAVGDDAGAAGIEPDRSEHEPTAAGARVGQLHANEDVHWLFNSSEAEPDIEYWLSDSKFHVVQDVYLYDENRFAPFVKHEFDLTKVPALSKVGLLLNANPSLVAEIPVLVKEIGSIDREDHSDRLGGLLFRLWRAGLSDPDQVCEEFRGFTAAKWHDGGMAEWVMSMTMELDLAQRAKANN